jgi:peptide/nickel transport system substrate-binding protein
VVLAVAAVLAAGCGGGEDDGSAATGGDGAPQGSRLVVLSDDVASSINPDGAEAASPATIAAIGNLHDTLIGYPVAEPDADGVLVPDYGEFEGRLAESWEASEDGLTWTFTLRDDVTSCAGNPLTADDVIWTFQRAKSVSGATPIAWFLANAGGVLPLDPVLPDATDEDRELRDTEVRKVDDRTVEFTLAQPTALFPRVLTVFGLVIFDSVEMTARATPDDPWAHGFADSQGAAGFGAYCLDSWEQGSEMTLTANPGYHAGEPAFTEVLLREVPESANRVAALQSGDADVATALAPNEYASLAGNDDVDVLGWFSNETVNLIVNYQYDLWQGEDGRALRQAVAHALPYDEIIASVFPDGSARRWYGMAPSDTVGFAEFKQYDTDLDRARELLAQAGHPDGLEAGDEALTLYYVVERKAWLEPLAVQVQSALAEVGIPLQLEPITQAEAATRALIRKDLPTAILDWLYPYVPDVGYHAQLFFLPPEAGGINNVMNYGEERIGALYAEAAALPAGDERNAKLAELQEQAMTDLPWVPLLERKTQVAVRGGITGFEGRPDNILTFWSLRPSS